MALFLAFFSPHKCKNPGYDMILILQSCISWIYPQFFTQLVSNRVSWLTSWGHISKIFSHAEKCPHASWKCLDETCGILIMSAAPTCSGQTRRNRRIHQKMRLICGDKFKGQNRLGRVLMLALFLRADFLHNLIRWIWQKHEGLLTLPVAS